MPGKKIYSEDSTLSRFRSGTAILNLDGVVSWCDKQISEIVSVDIRGLTWEDLVRDIWILPETEISIQRYKDLVSTLFESITIDIKLKNEQNYPNIYQLRIEVIHNPETGIPEQTILILSSAMFNDPEEVSCDVDTSLLLATIQQGSDSVMITDHNGVLLYVNPQFCKTTGFSREEAIGQNSNILKSGAHSDTCYKEMWKTIQAGKVWSGQLTNRKKNEMLFREEATISPLVDDAGKITHFFATKRDITREDTLDRQLQQAMKLEAIGTLAGGIANYFNTILSEIIGYSQSADFKLGKDNPVLEDLNKVLASAERAVDLVKQILTFAQQNSRHRFRPLEVQHVIKEALKLIRSSLPATIE